jgi:hypothetical protein
MYPTVSGFSLLCGSGSFLIRLPKMVQIHADRDPQHCFTHMIPSLEKNLSFINKERSMNAPRHTFEAHLPYAYFLAQTYRAPITFRHCQPFLIMLDDLEIIL